MLMPNGGWNRPIARLTVTTTPKCTGSMPAAFTSGTSSGLKSRIADNGSRKHPTSSSRTLMASSSIQAETLSDCSHWVMAAGTWFTVNNHANTPAQATMMRICPVNRTVAAAASTMSRQASSRHTKAGTNAAELAEHESSDEGGVDAGDRGCLGRREHAAIDATEDDDRGAERPQAAAGRAQEARALERFARPEVLTFRAPDHIGRQHGRDHQA